MYACKQAAQRPARMLGRRPRSGLSKRKKNKVAKRPWFFFWSQGSLSYWRLPALPFSPHRQTWSFVPPSWSLVQGHAHHDVTLEVSARCRDGVPFFVQFWEKISVFKQSIRSPWLVDVSFSNNQLSFSFFYSSFFFLFQTINFNLLEQMYASRPRSGLRA